MVGLEMGQSYAKRGRAGPATSSAGSVRDQLYAAPTAPTRKPSDAKTRAAPADLSQPKRGHRVLGNGCVFSPLGARRTSGSPPVVLGGDPFRDARPDRVSCCLLRVNMVFHQSDDARARPAFNTDPTATRRGFDRSEARRVDSRSQRSATRGRGRLRSGGGAVKLGWLAAPGTPQLTVTPPRQRSASAASTACRRASGPSRWRSCAAARSGQSLKHRCQATFT